MPEIQIKEALNKAFVKVRPERAAIDKFKANFIAMIDGINNNPTQTEEFLKNLVSDFLKNTWYAPDYFINTDKWVDLVIHNGSDSAPIGVMIEAKKPGNKNEMVSRGNLNAKAMQELLLYYLRETIEKENINIKHLIITNTIEWFIFDAHEFYRCFSKDKNLVGAFQDFKSNSLLGSNTDFFYSSIASPYIEKIKNDIEFTYFNIKDYEEIIRVQNKEDDNKLINLFKILSPEHLLKLSFINDSNTLNQKFYTELLYIMGLSEEKEGGKKIIVRNKPENRKEGSLIENTIFQLSDYSPKENELFEIALELIIIWIDRILFLKLLESQQLQYQKRNHDYAFLNIEKVKNYTDLNTLFFKVLAQEIKDRPESIRKLYAQVPYLNSSLFDMTEIEKSYFTIASLQEIEMPFFHGTVLKDRSGASRKGSLKTLDYIFEFLNAYDFSSEGSEDIQEENKTLINASVLGLIFEKINGYRDGSYFTPGFITTYICHETIRQVVVDKFNEVKGWKVGSFDELKNYIDNKSIAEIKEANNIINSITICDPAVGSGHFLVSALNEIIAIKSDLGVLADSKGVKLKSCTAEVVNDELMILDEDGNFYTYNVNNIESRRIQETIFQEKRRVIEGSLFGVDINPNSVKICRLRLWIELLKNAYYTEASGYAELETLPNIDINIKCGNSLINRFDIKAELNKNLLPPDCSIQDYKEAVYIYKDSSDKVEKNRLLDLIEKIKSNFKENMVKSDGLYNQRSILHKRLGALDGGTTEMDFITEAQKENIKKEIDKIEEELRTIEEKIEELNSGAIYENSFEWRFEFPELLDDDGDFTGFDVVIGNPPYIQLQDNHGELADIYGGIGYNCFSRSGDIYQLFYECGYKLLKEKRYLCFITSNKWMRAAYGEKTRNFFADKANPKILIDFAGQRVFESATVDVNILLLEKKKNEQNTVGCIIKDDCKNNMTDYIKQHGNSISFPTNGQSWVILSDIEKQINDKIEKIGKPLKDWDINIYRGVLTGCNAAFIIDKEKRDELIKQDEKSAEIIRPILRGRDIARYQINFAELYLINTHNGIPAKNIPPVDIKEYPAIKEHLDSYWSKIKNRDDQGITPYNLRSCAYTDDFSKQKILWAETMRIHKSDIKNFPRFGFTETEFFTDKTCFFATGDHLYYILAYLNSSLGRYLCKRYVSILDDGGYLMQKIYLEQIPIIKLQDSYVQELESICKNVFNEKTEMIELEINKKIFDLCGFKQDEIEYIENDNLEALFR